MIHHGLTFLLSCDVVVPRKLSQLLCLMFLPHVPLQYSYELLLQYLQKTQALVMLGIINERIIFEGTVSSLLRLYHAFYLPSLPKSFPPIFLYAILAVSAGQPSLISDDADVVALVGTSKDLAKQINQKEVHWGVCYLAPVINVFVSYFLFNQNG